MSFDWQTINHLSFVSVFVFLSESIQQEILLIRAWWLLGVYLITYINILKTRQTWYCTWPKALVKEFLSNFVSSDHGSNIVLYSIGGYCSIAFFTRELNIIFILFCGPVFFLHFLDHAVTFLYVTDGQQKALILLMVTNVDYVLSEYGKL